jgi:hypothetical protein
MPTVERNEGGRRAAYMTSHREGWSTGECLLERERGVAERQRLQEVEKKRGQEPLKK